LRDGAESGIFNIMNNVEKRDTVYRQTESGDFYSETAKARFVETVRQSGGTEPHVKNMVFYAQTTQLIEDADLKYPAMYDETGDVIYFNTKHPDFDKYDFNFIMAHELSHRMDMIQYFSWDDAEFTGAVRTAARKINNYADEMMALFRVGGKYENDESLSDIISALSKGGLKVPTGHPAEYWKQGDIYIATEIFSALSVMDVLGSSSLKIVETYFVEILNAYRRLVK